MRITSSGKRMLKLAQPGADEVDKQVLAAVPVSHRKSFTEALALLAAEMDRVEEESDTKPALKIKNRRRA